MENTRKAVGRESWCLGTWSAGVVFGLIGLFLIFAARSARSEQSEGAGGVVDTVSAQPFGQVMLVALATGLAFYGLF